MAYRPPQKRNSVLTQDFPTMTQTKHIEKHGTKPPQRNSTPKKEEFPALVPAKPDVAPVTKMNFASLFKNVEKKKKRAKRLKWGTVLLTKKGMIDSMTAEEREEEEAWQIQQTQEEKLWKMADRMVSQQNVRRVYDPHYESPDELTVSTSEEDPEEEEEEVLTDEFEEGEFEPEI